VTGITKSTLVQLDHSILIRGLNGLNLRDKTQRGMPRAFRI